MLISVSLLPQAAQQVRPDPGDRRDPRGPPDLRERRLRRGRHLPLHGLRDRRVHEAAGRHQRGLQDRVRELRGRRGQGNLKGDGQDGHLHPAVLQGRADLRGCRTGLGGR